MDSAPPMQIPPPSLACIVQPLPFDLSRLPLALGSHRAARVCPGPADVGKWDSWKISMPAALTYNLSDDKYNWAYQTV